MPVERTPNAQLLLQASRFRADSLVPRLLGAVPDLVLVLNQDRQIVFANQRFIRTVKLKPTVIFTHGQTSSDFLT